MPIVSLEPYVWLKWLHVLSSAVLLGAGLGTAYQLWSAHRSRKAKAILVVARAVVKADWRFTLPAGIVQPATGLGLAIVTGTPVNAPWLIASYVLYLVAFGCWVPAVMLQMQARDLADALRLSPGHEALVRARLARLRCAGADLPADDRQAAILVIRVCDQASASSSTRTVNPPA